MKVVSSAEKRGEVIRKGVCAFRLTIHHIIMAKFSAVVSILLSMLSIAWAQCGSGIPNARVTGSTGAYVATRVRHYSPS